MCAQLNINGGPPGPPFIKKNTYTINEKFLQRLGFKKIEVLSGQNEWVYRYYKPSKECNGIELIFIKDFCILSVEEFWLNHSNGFEQVSNTIVGKFSIYSDEDLQFIFSRNIRLNYLFNIAGKRV
ncbi:hypothetical protein [Ferruginibacter profundus]